MAANGNHGERRSREDARVRPPAPPELLAQVRGLPAGQPLMERLEGEPGLFLVGGAVRDLLLGGRPFDLDLVVEGDPRRIVERLGGEVLSHDRFGTSTVTVAGFAYDIARARRETYPHPGALPEVEPASLEEDLRRRDFTVNAIALALGGERPGELRSFPGALDDLDERRLRVLHPRSFLDDPTRLFRLARYRGRLGFAVEERTRQLAAEALAHGALATLSGPRIGHELRLAADERDPVAALLALGELGLDHGVHPRFGLADPDLARRGLALLPAEASPGRLVLAAAARGIAAAELRRLLDRLAFPAAERDVVLAAATRAEALARALAGAERPSAIARAVCGAPLEAVALAGALGAERAAADWLGRLRGVRLEIDGRDLRAAGVPEGPALGAGLRAALEAKLDGLAPSREAELAAALRAARDG
jgi:tRNA nucleotidyltransferase (CCA-adding enzyme)